MRDLLQRIRTRVDRLAAGMECDGLHQLTKVSLVEGGEPVPDWPPADAPTCCSCGAALEYIHLVHIHDLTEQVPWLTGRASQVSSKSCGRSIGHTI
jgi:hypothetical protein